jgi:hypothetical protein
LDGSSLHSSGELAPERSHAARRLPRIHTLTHESLLSLLQAVVQRLSQFARDILAR